MHSVNAMCTVKHTAGRSHIFWLRHVQQNAVWHSRAQGYSSAIDIVHHRVLAVKLKQAANCVRNIGSRCATCNRNGFEMASEVMLDLLICLCDHVDVYEADLAARFASWPPSEPPTGLNSSESRSVQMHRAEASLLQYSADLLIVANLRNENRSRLGHRTFTCNLRSLIAAFAKSDEACRAGHRTISSQFELKSAQNAILGAETLNISKICDFCEIK